MGIARKTPTFFRWLTFRLDRTDTIGVLQKENITVYSVAVPAPNLTANP